MGNICSNQRAIDTVERHSSTPVNNNAQSTGQTVRAVSNTSLQSLAETQAHPTQETSLPMVTHQISFTTTQALIEHEQAQKTPISTPQKPCYQKQLLQVLTEIPTLSAFLDLKNTTMFSQTVSKSCQQAIVSNASNPALQILAAKTIKDLPSPPTLQHFLTQRENKHQQEHAQQRFLNQQNQWKTIAFEGLLQFVQRQQLISSENIPQKNNPNATSAPFTMNKKEWAHLSKLLGIVFSATKKNLESFPFLACSQFVDWIIKQSNSWNGSQKHAALQALFPVFGGEAPLYSFDTKTLNAWLTGPNGLSQESTFRESIQEVLTWINTCQRGSWNFWQRLYTPQHTEPHSPSSSALSLSALANRTFALDMPASSLSNTVSIRLVERPIVPRATDEDRQHIFKILGTVRRDGSMFRYLDQIQDNRELFILAWNQISTAPINQAHQAQLAISLSKKLRADPNIKQLILSKRPDLEELLTTDF